VASKTVLIDDLDGKTEGAEPTFFSLDDVFYKIDLADANRKKLTDFLQAYIDKGYRVEGPKGGRRTPAGSTNGFGEIDPAVVRAWAQANNIPVGDKGRVPEEIVNRYKLAKAEENSTNK
jgi:Lsr2